jgi:3-oxoacyl-[acyl-carrier-protein] synthase-3
MTTTKTRKAYITSAGSFLPGPPVDNDTIEEILGKVGGKESRLKKRILTQNGIKTRHYALNREGRTTHLNEELAAHAITDALSRRGLPLEAIEMLACGTTQGDLPVPGFASMVHGRLGGGPLEVLSAGGVCCSGMAALAGVARAVALGERKAGVACGSELVSRMLKASRFEEEGTLEGNDDGRDKSTEAMGSFRMFDADFLRWMLSDGAGAVVVEPKPKDAGLSLRIEWIDVVSHAHDNATCMYTGIADKDAPRAGNSWLDQPTIAAADQTGMMKIRQDTRLLPRIVRLGVEEYLRHLRDGRLNVQQIDHVLCHYSSHFFKGEVMKLLAEAGVVVPEERWFTNLYTKGNTGAASIFIMIEEALNSGRFKKGEKIVLMVPESGRFSVAFALLTVVDGSDVEEQTEDAGTTASTSLNTSLTEKRWSTSPVVSRPKQDTSAAAIAAALQKSPLGREFADDADERVQKLVIELGLVWADFERMLDATPILTRLREGTITLADYQRLLVNLRQQVMEGARWIARAASSLSIELFPLRSMFITHAGEEHRDFQILERDYVATGGDLHVIQSAPKNVGSEALSAFMFHRASQPDPLDLLGAMFIIEGLGTAKAHQWAEQLKDTLKLDDHQVKFLSYHGGNDDRHFDKLRDVVRSGFVDDAVAARIVKTARTVARLYALQLEEIDHV